MLDTSMNSILFAKKLRARQSELKVAHKKALEKYARDFEDWKRALSDFIVTQAPKNIAKITRGTLSNDRYGNRDWVQIVLNGYPQPPTQPNDRVIRKIASALRTIAITGQKTVHVNQSDLDTFFGDEKDDDE